MNESKVNAVQTEEKERVITVTHSNMLGAAKSETKSQTQNTRKKTKHKNESKIGAV